MSDILGNIPEWIAGVASAVAALGVWFLREQIRLLKEQIQTDHERSRRQTAIDLNMEWSKNLQQHTSLARKLVETFTVEESEKLYKSEPLTLDLSKQAMVEGYFGPTNPIKQENGRLKLDVSNVSTLRWHIVSLLNMLESILSAYRHNVADRGIIKEELRYLVSPSKGYYLLQNFRTVAGHPTNYPAIEEFVRELKEDFAKLEKGKPPIAT
jgi:hypothetical protein